MGVDMPFNSKITGSLNAFFSLKNFTDVITELPKPKTPMTDLLFPASNRRLKASPFIAVQDIQDETGAVPVITRGSRSYSVGIEKRSLGMIEVAPLTMSRLITGAELNTLAAMGDTDGINAKLSETVENLRDRTAVSTEILVCQSLSGKIEYPVRVEGGASDTYTVELGKPVTVSAASLNASSKLSDVLKALETQFIAQQKTGCAGDVRFLCGSDFYALVIELVAGATGNVPVQWTDYGCILYGKYRLMPMSTTYSLPGKTDVTSVIDSKSVQTVDLTHTGKLFYAALDELDAQMHALPFFASYEEIKDPSAVKVLTSSKPLPAFAVSKSTIKKYL